MTWANVYLVCFLVGFTLSLLSFLMAGLHLHAPHAHFHGDVHFGPHAADAGAHGAGAGEISWFNFGTITAFLAWFGGTGYLLARYSAFVVWTVFVLSFLAGVAGAGVLFWFIARVLMPHDKALDPRDYEMVGVLGTITVPVRAGGTGEIVFSQEGIRRCSGARSEDGGAIAKETEVVVTRYEKGIAYVRPWDELTNTARTSGEQERRQN